jgi:GT2 family glycosyltransferase
MPSTDDVTHSDIAPLEPAHDTDPAGAKRSRWLEHASPQCTSSGELAVPQKPRVAAQTEGEVPADQYQALERKYQDLLERFSAKEEEVDALKASTSWRVTAPLRALRFATKGRAANMFRRIWARLRQIRHLSRVSSPLKENPENSPHSFSGGEAPSLSGYASFSTYSERSSNFNPDAPIALVKVRRSEFRDTVNALSLPQSDRPVVSVIIPVFNNAIITLECLVSIVQHPPNVEIELILVDDGSTEVEVRLLGEIDGIRLIRNASNTGFLRSVNRAVADAKGTYVLLLNNDTQVRAGWLDNMLEEATSVELAVVGAKLIYPSGHLQEGGVCMRSDGSAQLVGLNADPHDPLFNTKREVDYCSGACVLLEKALFERIGGFDEQFVPAYFEDADLGFQVRKLGGKNLYCPKAEVIHHLSVSAATQGDKLRQIAINKERFIDKWAEELTAIDQVKLIAFYLPQFHPIPENDAWWGKGFTEWSNVARAKPNYRGHYQPHLPADLGFYDLRLPEIQEQQAALASQYGIHGFCYYYYWFNGKRLLHAPLEQMIRSKRPDFPFCVCWANENWSRRWDGRDQDLLISQTYSEADDEAFIKALFPAFDDRRYIRVAGRPLLLIYRADLLPDAEATTERWRTAAVNAGFAEPYIAHVLSFRRTTCVAPGFDAAVEFPPHGRAVPYSGRLNITNPRFQGRLYDYRATALNFQRLFYPGQNVFRTVMPSWDNTARRQDHSDVFVNASPELFQCWLHEAIKETRELKFGDERLVFINAWNEWAEGNHLEPDQRFQHSYLEATGRALSAALSR